MKLSLARAIYSNADVYLLDDPLSAIENVEQAHFIHKYCLKGVIKDKCVVHVVTNEQFYKDEQRVLLLTSDGKARQISADANGRLNLPADEFADPSTVSPLFFADQSKM